MGGCIEEAGRRRRWRRVVGSVGLRNEVVSCWGFTTQLREQKEDHTGSSQTHTNAPPDTQGRHWGGGGEEGESAGMAMYEPAYLPPNAEEQDFIQAYENVREKYKGESGCALAVMTVAGVCMCEEGERSSVSRCKHVTIYMFLWTLDHHLTTEGVIDWHTSSSSLPHDASVNMRSGSQWIYSTGSLWYVSMVTVLLHWPLTCNRTEVCWLLSCKHTQQRTFQAKLLMDTVDLFPWTLRLLSSGCIPCWSVTWYTRASSYLHWRCEGKSQHISVTVTHRPGVSRLCVFHFSSCVLLGTSVSRTASL